MPKSVTTTRYVVQKKKALPEWEDVSWFRNLEDAQKCIPYVRKDTQRDIRIMRCDTTVMEVNHGSI